MQTKASLFKITATCVALFGLATANAQLVFDADTIAGNAGDDVTSWTAGSVTLTPVGTAPKLGVTGGGQKYVDFNDTDLSAANVPSTIAGASESAILMVYRNTTPGGTAVVWTDSSRILNLAETTDFATPTTVIFNQGGLTDNVTAPTSSTPEWTDGNWHIVTAYRKGTEAQIRIDGAVVSTASSFSGSTPAWPNNVFGTLYVGGGPVSNGPNDNWDGDIAEIQIWSSVPSDINAVELALGTEYGLTVVPEPSEYAMIFGLACVAGALALRYRRQQLAS